MDVYTVKFSFSCKAQVRAKSYEDAIQLGLMQIDPNKVEMERECVVQKGTEQPIIAELRKE